jgi:hypothetical protein
MLHGYRLQHQVVNKSNILVMQESNVASTEWPLAIPYQEHDTEQHSGVCWIQYIRPNRH